MVVLEGGGEFNVQGTPVPSEHTTRFAAEQGEGDARFGPRFGQYYPHSSLSSSVQYRATSLIRNSPHLGPYSRALSRAIRWPWGRVAIASGRASGITTPLSFALWGCNPVQDGWGGFTQSCPLREVRPLPLSLLLRPVQGYLAHTKPPPPLGPPWGVGLL